MHFEKTGEVSHPASCVLDTMIHRMEDIVPFLPNVDDIDTREVEDLSDGRVRIIRHWQGAANNVPSALRPFVSEELLGWIDTAVWHPDEYKVDWTLSTSFGRLYDCGGVNYFEPHPEEPKTRTRIRITGELTVYPDKLPGLPSLLGRRLAPQIEKFVVALITPNLMDVADGLQGYLDGQEKAGRKKGGRKGKKKA